MGYLEKMKRVLRLRTDPVAMYIRDESHGLERFVGNVSATCSLWSIAGKSGDGFYTLKEDHNCSIGRVTHGYDTADDVKESYDVRLLTSMGWISVEDIERLPRLPSKRVIAYSTKDDDSDTPDVVIVICSAEQAMLIVDAARRSGIPINLRSKPTCACIADAYLSKGITVGLGCTVSRIRTPYDPDSLFIAIHGRCLSRLLDNLEHVRCVDDRLHCSRDMLLKL